MVLYLNPSQWKEDWKILQALQIFNEFIQLNEKRIERLARLWDFCFLADGTQWKEDWKNK